MPHQANDRITDAMFKALELADDVVVARDIINHGKASAASIPLAIEALLASGEAKSGQTALDFGAGLGLRRPGDRLP